MEEKSMRDMFRLGFGEEVANCVTHGIMAFLCICSLPAAGSHLYILCNSRKLYTDCTDADWRMAGLSDTGNRMECSAWRCAVKGHQLKKLSQAFHDHLYDYGLDGYLLSADAAVKGKSSVSRIDCRRRCYVYDWRLLLWKATKKILSFRLACLYQSGKYSAFHCHRIRDVICQVRTGLKQKITPRALLTGL